MPSGFHLGVAVLSQPSHTMLYTSIKKELLITASLIN